MGKIKNYKEHLLKSLQDPEEAAAYLDACLDDDDPSVFLMALKDVTDAQGGMSKLSKNSSLNRQSLYRAFSQKGNPKLLSIRSILSSLGLSLHVTAPFEKNHKRRHSRKSKETPALDRKSL